MKRIKSIKWKFKYKDDIRIFEDKIVKCYKPKKCEVCNKIINSFRVIFASADNENKSKITSKSFYCLKCYLNWLKDKTKFKEVKVFNHEKVIKQIKEDYSDILVLEEI